MTASKVPSRRERADVQLVEDELVERQPGPGSIAKRGRVDDPRRAADALGLVAEQDRGAPAAVEHEDVVVAGRRVDDTRVHALADRLELLVGPTYAHGHARMRSAPTRETPHRPPVAERPRRAAARPASTSPGTVPARAGANRSHAWPPASAGPGAPVRSGDGRPPGTRRRPRRRGSVRGDGVRGELGDQPLRDRLGRLRAARACGRVLRGAGVHAARPRAADSGQARGRRSDPLGAACSAFVSPGLAFASGSAILVSELCDFAVYTPLARRRPITAVAASNTVGAVVDSFVFLSLAFHSLALFWGQVVGKSWVTLATVLVLLAARSAAATRRPAGAR